MRVQRIEWIVLSALSLLSLALQAAFTTADFQGADAVTHLEFARQGQDFSYWLDPTAFNGNYFPMGYGSFLALMMKFSGGSTVPVQILQLALGVGLAWLAWIMLRPLGSLIRVLTFTTIAFSPAVIAMSSQNGYEIILAFCIMSALTVSLLIRDHRIFTPKGRKSGLIYVGLALGLGALFQFKILVLIPVLLFILWNQSIKSRIWFLAISIAPTAMWALRNKYVLDTWNPSSTNSGMSLWLGNNWDATNGELLVKPPPLPPQFSSFYEASLNFLITQPEKAYGLQLRKIGRLLEPNYLYPQWKIIPGQEVLIQYVLIGMSAFTVLLFAAFLFGRLWVSPPQIPPVGFQALLVTVFFTMQLPFLAEQRYTGPVVPIALTVAIPTLIYLARRWKGSLALPPRSGV